VVIALAAGLLATGCGHPSPGARGWHRPAELPAEFTATFTVSLDGRVSAGGPAGVITGAGVYPARAGAETSMDPGPGRALIIIRHRHDGRLIDSVYRIAAGKEIVVTAGGRTVISVLSREVIIDASRGSITRIEVRSAPRRAKREVAAVTQGRTATSIWPRNQNT